MKTPEEIKKLIDYCYQSNSCSECSYNKKDFPECVRRIYRDATECITHQENRIAELEGRSLNTMRDVELVKVPRWIKPKEELPKGGKSDMEFCEIVNIVLKNGDVTSGWMNGYEGFAYVIRGDNDYISRVPITDVEYWMPLPKHPRAKPEPPKGV